MNLTGCFHGMDGDEIFTQNVIIEFIYRELMIVILANLVSIIRLFREGVNRDFAGAGNASFMPTNSRHSGYCGGVMVTRGATLSPHPLPQT